MAFYSQMDRAHASVMVMSPPKDHAMSLLAHSVTPEGVIGCPSYSNHNSIPRTSHHLTTSAITSRSLKRSRDEVNDSSTVEDTPSCSANETSLPKHKTDEIYGEGMVLLSPNSGLSISAESQTGTWCEEKAEAVSQQPILTTVRPRLPASRKSRRMDQKVPDPLQLWDHKGSSAPETPPKSYNPRPTVDDCTYALGIGWTRVASEDPDVGAAARGWARYLENHYSRYIHDAEIWLKSKGLNAYLVSCREGFYLFNEDLLEGRLVGRTWQSCLQNLRSHPIAFDGDEALRAERTPGPDARFAANFVKEEAVADGIAGGDDVDVNAQMELD